MDPYFLVNALLFSSPLDSILIWPSFFVHHHDGVQPLQSSYIKKHTCLMCREGGGRGEGGRKRKMEGVEEEEAP